MTEHLDAAQIARLEALKLAERMRGKRDDGPDFLAAAAAIAHFILTGEMPSDGDRA